MRAIFLSSACFGYVHIYAFDPAAYCNAAAPARSAAPMPVVDTKASHMPTAGDPSLARLAAWVQQQTEEATC
jgi:hypothetical protein